MTRQILVAALAALGLACAAEEAPAPVYQAIPVERRDIVVSVEAAGTVEPDVTVEVKSKASGEILELEAETGEVVERGALLVRIDQRQPRNAREQAEAQLEVARASLAHAEAEKRRAEELFAAQSISETARDQAVLDHAVARAGVVGAKVAVENARIELDDTDVLAPITGTILKRNVERGQVISSPTRDVSGGTVLLTMADLAQVVVNALVDETDIGKIAPELLASVTVAAYPSQPFEGRVTKIEPQAVTEQNVTMFPVRIRVENRDGLLRPGMNCEVEIHVGRREGVVAIPNAALRTPRDAGSVAKVLGLPQPDLPEAGGDYVVFVLRDGEPAPVWVRTGLTNLDTIEVTQGLSPGDEVLVLPSAGLLESQQRFRDRVKQVTGGGLPGVRSQGR